MEVPPEWIINQAVNDCLQISTFIVTLTIFNFDLFAVNVDPSPKVTLLS